MKFKDVLAIVTSQAGCQHVLAFAGQLAKRNSGRLSVAVVNWQPNVTPVDGFTMDTMYAELVKEAQKQLNVETDKIMKQLSGETETRFVQPFLIHMGAAGAAIGMRARHADISIVARPHADGPQSGHAILEAALFETGRPVIAVPPGWKKGVGSNVMIAWKPTREAARALADADDFIAAADKVSIVTVDAKPSQGYGQRPGADIAAHLALRGAKPELFNLDSAGRTETAAILDQAMAVGADLLVMGAYGRSRMSQFIFGGVTRDIVTTSSLPVLMSH